MPRERLLVASCFEQIVKDLYNVLVYTNLRNGICAFV